MGRERWVEEGKGRIRCVVVVGGGGGERMGIGFDCIRKRKGIGRDKRWEAEGKEEEEGRDWGERGKRGGERGWEWEDL